MTAIPLRSIATIALLLAGSACDGPARSQPPATQPAAKPVNAKCPVNGDDVYAAGQTVVYEGKVVGFCCDECVEPFRKNPAKYAVK